MSFAAKFAAPTRRAPLTPTANARVPRWPGPPAELNFRALAFACASALGARMFHSSAADAQAPGGTLGPYLQAPAIATPTGVLPGMIHRPNFVCLLFFVSFGASNYKVKRDAADTVLLGAPPINSENR
ncbi:hypothetical protein DFH07DRAFT_935736 [Mycena maculata]|uniref:Uncharacterized protein n=1 Tax=Mycena maculata TaxID=230809 RepID=A0AAD7NZU4_9AGAR|nr:hypothetical protein DFH07DRAFT_935736 [Mycena maculata]